MIIRGRRTGAKGRPPPSLWRRSGYPQDDASSLALLIIMTMTLSSSVVKGEGEDIIDVPETLTAEVFTWLGVCALVCLSGESEPQVVRCEPQESSCIYLVEL